MRNIRWLVAGIITLALCTNHMTGTETAEGFIALFNGKDLTGWKKVHPDNARNSKRNSWKAENGLLVNAAAGCDLATVEKFADFELHLEYRLPGGGNSGVYLRGRYEIQIADDYRRRPSLRSTGAIYNLIPPSENASTQAMEWQTVDVKLVGKQVTVRLNGKTVIADAELPFATAGAMSSNVNQPGPIMLQGQLGPIAFRNIQIKPLK
ncbi:MAG: DUF1080 domain-containing protein [Verrucomicrobiia bacterium]